MLSELIPIMQFVIEKYGIYGAVAIGFGAFIGLIGYQFRIREHIREEKRIDDTHFAKVKEHIQDTLDGLHEVMLQRGLTLLYDKDSIPPIEGCATLAGYDCRILQRERFENDLSKVCETKIKFKVIGWMRENGFHQYDELELAKYSDLRVNSLEKAFTKSISDRARVRFPDVSTKINKIILKKDLHDFFTDCVKFAVIEHNEADRDIENYRANHGMLPARLMKMLINLKGK
jgi:hypothetical protein